MLEPAKDLFVGVDGGATKTHVIITDAAGVAVGEAFGPPSTLALSAPRAWEAIRQTIHSALAEEHGRRRMHLGIGTAATEVRVERERLVSLISGFETVRLEADALIACIGAHGFDDGAIVAVGTGIVGFRILNDSTSLVSGWGFPQDDRGSGAWLGLESINATFCTLDGRLRPSALTRAILERCGGGADGLVEWARVARAPDYATLAREVVAHAQAGDAVAQDIMQHTAGAVARIADALVADTPEHFPLSLVGGLGPFMQPLLPDRLRGRLRDPRYTSALGAAMMIRRTVLGDTAS